jgi:phosphohistidine phosphatase SixA
MRHSERYDQTTAQQHESVVWPDRQTRFWDTPICDFELPHQQALKLHSFRINHVVSSPFRRCLQTAAVVCRTLGINTIEVDVQLCEEMGCVVKCLPPRYSTSQLLEFNILSAHEMCDIVGPGIRITNVDYIDEAPLPSIKEHRDEGGARVTAALSRHHQENMHRNTLIVGHGFTVEQFGMYLRPAQYMPAAQYCGFVVMKSSNRELISTDRVPLAVPGECSCS